MASVPLASPPTAEEIAAQLTNGRLMVGWDFVCCLTTVGGMLDTEMDPNCWSFWSLDKILAENQRIKSDDVYFADWLIHSYCHFARRETDDRSSVWVDYFDSTGGSKVADSLENFLERYLARDQSIGIPFE